MIGPLPGRTQNSGPIFQKSFESQKYLTADYADRTGLFGTLIFASGFGFFPSGFYLRHLRSNSGGLVSDFPPASLFRCQPRLTLRFRGVCGALYPIRHPRSIDGWAPS
jgi:hypothetical protein